MALGDPTLIPDAQMTADALHFLKNTPSIPEALSVDPQMRKPYVYQEYPRAMHHASGETTLVHNDNAREVARNQGYFDSPIEAQAAKQAQQRAISKAALHRAHDDRNLSPAAQQELEAAEDSVEHHVLDPKLKRRGSGKIDVIDA